MPDGSRSILIVGAGPTGLALAYMLYRQGLMPRIVDAKSGPTHESRALALHARTLEVLGHELAAELVARGQQLHQAQVFDGAKQLVELSLAGTPTLYPFGLGLAQSEIERVLVARLAGVGIEVEWNTRLVELVQDEHGVSAVLAGSAGGQDQGRYAWVIGCDGVRSTTRELAGIGLDLAQHPRWWMLADVRLEGELPAHDTARVFLGSAGVMALMPLHRAEWWRVIGVGEVSEERPEVTVQTVQALLAERCPLPVRILEEDWLSAFRIREHVATAYRAGRVLIAGDAAHAHSPLGGQGMNTGIQDASNLAWKLALVCRGASTELLDSYEVERRPLAQALVKATGRSTRMMYASASWLVWLRNRLLQQLIKLESVSDRIRMAVEMLAIAYPESPIVGEKSSSSRAGDVDPELALELPDRAARRALRSAAGPGERAPLELPRVRQLVDSPKHVVLLFDGKVGSAAGYARMREAAARIERLGAEHFHVAAVVPSLEASTQLAEGVAEVVVDEDRAMHTAFGAESETLVVVRPDGYIGWRSQPIDVDALVDWWQRVTGLA